MIKAGVIGDPVHHSLSPVVHHYWMDKYGISGSYDKFEVKSAALQSFLQTLPERGLVGVNVTIPHKEAVLKSMHLCDEAAEFIQAVNTVVLDQEGHLIGRNTDVYGFVRNLTENAPDYPYEGGTAVVLGAGGACRAVLAGLLGDMKLDKVILLNRTREKCEAIKQSFFHAINNMLVKGGDVEEVQAKAQAFADKIVIEDWDDRHAMVETAQLVVNTTALGMVRQPELDIELALLSTQALVTDIVFNPLETGLLRQARERGNPVVDGLGMLLHQAAPGFKAWFDPQDKHIEGLPEVDDGLRQHVLAALANSV